MVLVTFTRSPVVPFYPFLGEGSRTKIDYRKKGTLILSSLLEDLVYFPFAVASFSPCKAETGRGVSFFANAVVQVPEPPRRKAGMATGMQQGGRIASSGGGS